MKIAVDFDGTVVDRRYPEVGHSWVSNEDGTWVR